MHSSSEQTEKEGVVVGEEAFRPFFGGGGGGLAWFRHQCNNYGLIHYLIGS